MPQTWHLQVVLPGHEVSLQFPSDRVAGMAGAGRISLKAPRTSHGGGKQQTSSMPPRSFRPLPMLKSASWRIVRKGLYHRDTADTGMLAVCTADCAVARCRSEYSAGVKQRGAQCPAESPSPFTSPQRLGITGAPSPYCTSIPGLREGFMQDLLCPSPQMAVKGCPHVPSPDFLPC